MDDDARGSRQGLVQPFDSDLGSARVDRGGDAPVTGSSRDVTSGGHPDRAVAQQRPVPPVEMVGTAGPGSGEPGDEHGSSGQDVGSMDAPDAAGGEPAKR